MGARQIILLLLLCVAALLPGRGQQLTSHQLKNGMQMGSYLNPIWDLSAAWRLKTEISYSDLLFVSNPWNKLTAAVDAEYELHQWIQFMGGIRWSRVQQNEQEITNEFRPSLAVRLVAFANKRYVLRNLFRLEARFIDYKTPGNFSTSGRIRNRLMLGYSLNQKDMFYDKNFILAGGVEIYYNFEQVSERFSNQLLYRIDLGYRLSYRWRFGLTGLFQQSRNTIPDGPPSQLPITGFAQSNFILEGRVFIIFN